MTLSTLLARACVSTWDESMWFRGAALKGPVLFIVGSDADVRFVDRAWGPAFRDQVSDLMIRRALPEPAPSRPSSIFKKGYQPLAQADMLDEP